MAAWPKLVWDSEPTGPLKGIKVVDMATVVLGPYATVQLADLGAEVIKIENSEGNTPGDLMRYAGASPTGDLGPIFAALNRNKKAINLNIKQDADKAVLTELLKGADVFIHNVRMAGMERLGFGYDEVKAINPDIVYVHCAGFGAGGAYGERQAYDDLIQAASGFAALSEQRDGGRPPMRHRWSPTRLAVCSRPMRQWRRCSREPVAKAGSLSKCRCLNASHGFTWSKIYGAKPSFPAMVSSAIRGPSIHAVVPIRPRTASSRLSPIMTGNGRSFLNWEAGRTYSMTRALPLIRSAPSIPVNYMR